MATVKFSVKGKSETSTVFVRVRDGRNTDIEVSTEYTINPIHWSKVKGEPKQSAENQNKLNLKLQLEKLKLKIIETLNSDKGTGIEINSEWLKLVIAKYKDPSKEKKTEYLIDFVRDYQSEMKVKINPRTEKPISQATIRNFNTTLMRLEKFEKFKKKRYFLHNVDLTFHTDFKKFESNVLLLSQNSISKDLKQIKTVCLDAFDKGYTISEQVRSKKFNAPTEKTLFVTITEDEIEKIKKFKGSDYLENAKDWLIIGCWTGCRVNDLMLLSKDNILINPKGQKFIRYTQSKTNKQVDLPIHPDVNEILIRLGNFPRPISDQRFNEWIKIVCRESGLINEVHGTRQNPKTHLKEIGTFQKWELIRSHTCRRSFATNHYNKLSNKLIMAVTGHATERMLLSYIGETENTHLNDFLDVWNTPKVEDEKIVSMNDKQA